MVLGQIEGGLSTDGGQSWDRWRAVLVQMEGSLRTDGGQSWDKMEGSFSPDGGRLAGIQDPGASLAGGRRQLTCPTLDLACKAIANLSQELQPFHSVW